MKKGMCVTLDDGRELVLVDSVTHQDTKYFAATSKDETIEDLSFFRLLYDENGEEHLEELVTEEYAEVIDALINHIMQMNVE